MENIWCVEQTITFCVYGKHAPNESACEHRIVQSLTQFAILAFGYTIQ
jgi:hypothetical protein